MAICSYAGRFSTIVLVLFGNILRYIGFEVATYKNISLARPAELGSDKLPILLSLPANKNVLKYLYLLHYFRNPADALWRGLYRKRIGRYNVSVCDQIGHIDTSNQMKKIYHEPIGHKICPVIIRLDTYIRPIR